jgi:hypothetical protein
VGSPRAEWVGKVASPDGTIKNKFHLPSGEDVLTSEIITVQEVMKSDYDGTAVRLWSYDTGIRDEMKLMRAPTSSAPGILLGRIRFPAGDPVGDYLGPTRFFVVELPPRGSTTYKKV